MITKFFAAAFIMVVKAGKRGFRMKKIICILLAAFMGLMVLSGCQKTPDEAIVIGKGSGQLEEKIQDAEISVSEILPGQNSKIEQIIEHETLPIRIIVDADVQLPKAGSFPSVKVQPRTFTEQEIAMTCDYFIGDAYFADYKSAESTGLSFKEKVQINIDDIKNNIAYAKERQPQDTAYIERLQEQLITEQKDLLNAVEITDLPKASRTADESGRVLGNFIKDGKVFRFFVNNGSAKQSYMELSRESIVDINDLTEISYEHALHIAEEAIENIGANEYGFQLLSAEEKNETGAYPTGQYFSFVFTRSINDVYCGYDRTESVDGFEGMNEEDRYEMVFDEPWPYEYLMIDVDAHSIRRLVWQSPVTITETVSENTALLPFEQVMECFAKMAFIKNAYLEQELDFEYVNANAKSKVVSMDIHIKKIMLSLMRVQSGTEYFLIPVWDFYGYRDHLDENGVEYSLALGAATEEEIKQANETEMKYSFLTINAIDGSIIDRGLGY